MSGMRAFERDAICRGPTPLPKSFTHPLSSVLQSVSQFHGPTPRSPHRLSIRLRRSRSTTSTEYSLPGATQLSQVRSVSPSEQGDQGSRVAMKKDKADDGAARGGWRRPICTQGGNGWPDRCAAHDDDIDTFPLTPEIRIPKNPACISVAHYALRRPHHN